MIKYIGQHIFDFIARFRSDVYVSGTTRLDGDLRMDGATISSIQTSAESFADNNTSIMTSAAIDDRINAAAGGVTSDPFNTTVIKVLPNQFVINDDAGRPLMVEDDTSKTAGDLNANIDITDIPSSATQDLVIKVSPASGSTIVYGATVTIATI
jgi:hypothetical protein